MAPRKSKWEPQRFSFVYENASPDEISEVYRKSLLPIRFEATDRGGRISNEHLQMGLADWQVWSCHCRSGMRLSYKDVPDSGNYVLYVADAGIMDITVGQKQFRSSDDCYFVGKIDHFDRIHINPMRSHLAVSFSPASICRQLAEMIDDAVVKDIIFSENVRLIGPKSAQLLASVRLAAHHLKGDALVISPEFYRHFLDAITALLLETVPNNFSERLTKRISPAMPRHMKKAIDFMQANAASPLTISDIAQAAGTSVRSLQDAFQQFRDTTPLTHLRMIRLNGARASLKSTDGYLTVAEVAKRWGFTHVGAVLDAIFRSFWRVPFSDYKKQIALCIISGTNR